MTYFPLLLDHTTLLPNKTHVGIAFTQISEELSFGQIFCFVT
jgi:hypothetical protein